MAHRKEREEGLFTRLGATRILCVVVLLGWLVATLGAIFLVRVLFFYGGATTVQFGSGFLVMYVAAVVSGVAALVLYWWRRCDQCRRRLFAENSPPAGVTPPSGQPWLDRDWWIRNTAQAPRDYRAQQLLGSYRTAIVVRLALTGRLRCQWCGHDDGTKPDYVAKGD